MQRCLSLNELSSESLIEKAKLTQRSYSGPQVNRTRHYLFSDNPGYSLLSRDYTENPRYLFEIFRYYTTRQLIAIFRVYCVESDCSQPLDAIRVWLGHNVVTCSQIAREIILRRVLGIASTHYKYDEDNEDGITGAHGYDYPVKHHRIII